MLLNYQMRKMMTVLTNAPTIVQSFCFLLLGLLPATQRKTHGGPGQVYQSMLLCHLPTLLRMSFKLSEDTMWLSLVLTTPIRLSLRHWIPCDASPHPQAHLHHHPTTSPLLHVLLCQTSPVVTLLTQQHLVRLATLVWHQNFASSSLITSGLRLRLHWLFLTLKSCMLEVLNSWFKQARAMGAYSYNTGWNDLFVTWHSVVVT